LKSSYKDNIFKKKKTSRWPFYFIFLILCGSAYLFLKPTVSTTEIIEKNQKIAIKNCKIILNALNKWKKNDYDANGENDYFLGPLKLFSNIKFVSGKKICILPKEISNAEYRLKNRLAHEGYFYTLSAINTKWKTEGVPTTEIYIVAIPEKRGKTGTCIFLLNSKNEALYCNTEYSKKIPTWPNHLEERLKIWKKIIF